MVSATIKADVEVTAADIKNGLCASSTKCPIALALKRQLPKDSILYVYPDRAYAYFGPNRECHYQAALPKKAHDFVMDFDYGKGKAEPIKFKLRFKEDD